METAMVSHNRYAYLNTTLTYISSFFNFNTKSGFLYSKTLTPKPCSNFPSLSLPHAIPKTNSTKHTTLLVETFHEHRTLKSLLSKLSKTQSCPLQLLTDYGDWSTDHFRVVVKFLLQSSRSPQVLQLFNVWKNIEKSRINEFNYEKIIVLLCEEDLMDDAVSAFQDMKSHGLEASLVILNSLIHGFSRNGNFDVALFYLNEMKEIDLARETDTYDGLIQAYGKYRMYDEMAMCVKKMKMDGCSPNHITYNLLIRELSKGGLLKRMERIHQTLISERMNLQSATLVAMLEAYTNYGILDKMEWVYRRIQNLKVPLKEDLIRKMAGVYIQNYMFSRLHTLGTDLSKITKNAGLIWCLRLLSHACLLSRNGMDLIVQEMDEAKMFWNATFANIILLAYLKMKDFTRLRTLLSEIPARRVKPDIVTFGILLDATNMGFGGDGALESWKRMGFLYKEVEMNTDPLVLAAFGKGKFLRDCEEAYSNLGPNAIAKKTWTYENLIDLVFEHNKRLHKRS